MAELSGWFGNGDIDATLPLTPRNFKRIKAGTPFSIRGKGIVGEGEFFWDNWYFNYEHKGSLEIWYGDDGAQLFVGDWEDLNLTMLHDENDKD